MPTRYFLATAPDGTVFKRSSQNRAYSHCVVNKRDHRAATEAEIAAMADRRWFKAEAWISYTASWASREDLARKQYAQALRKPYDPEGRITSTALMLDAVEVDGPTFRKTEGIH